MYATSASCVMPPPRALLCLVVLSLLTLASGGASGDRPRPSVHHVKQEAAFKSVRDLSPQDFVVDSLPGLKEEPPFAMYAGFMPLTNCTHKKLFFWLVESERDPANDPLVLWLNGGPGSSSLAYGFWTEHGPFRLQQDESSGDIFPSPYQYAWNKIANVIYVEAPVGVGFSYSDVRSDYFNITDAESSLDNFRFLLSFFEVFGDKFGENDFYITAESYGGHYGPTLAEQLIDNPNDINMKGLWIGNPGINSDWYYNVNEYAFVTFLWNHGLIPLNAYVAARDACGWTEFLKNCTRDFTHPSKECLAATTTAVGYMPSPLDPYNVLVPTCHTDDDDEDKALARDQHVAKQFPFLAEFRRRHGLENSLRFTYDPCLNELTPQYMNRKDVTAAVNIDPDHDTDGRWPGDAVGWYYNQGPEGSKKDIALIYPKFFKMRPEWKYVVVSGTADAAVPFIGSERWIACLDRPIKNDFHAWYMNEDVAGTVLEYDLITFVTIKACGHTVPTYCPEQGLLMLSKWLDGSF